jgi:hypothetical protein
MGSLVQFREYASSATTADSFPSGPASGGRAPTLAIREPAPGEPSAITDLYPEDAGRSVSLTSALSLLAEGLNAIDRAILGRQQQDMVAADDYLMQFFALTPELFCCRDLGEGFAQAAAALCALRLNIDGLDISVEQLHALRHFVKGLRDVPFLSMERTTEALMKLEDAGYDVGFEPLTELLSESE